MIDGDKRDNEQAKLRIETLTAVATGLAHEYSDLMTIVLSSLEQLRRQPLDETGQQQLDRAERGVRTAARLTRQVLSLAGRRPGPELPVDINRVIAGFDTMMRQALGDASTLALELAPEPLPVRLEGSQLELALLNLVRNAGEAMPEGGRVTVRTAGDPSSSAVEIAVVDTGVGMPPEIVERASEPFFSTKRRERRPGQPRRGRLGLGLSMVKGLLAHCGGRMAIDTAPGRGTTVRLILPRSTEHPMGLGTDPV
jgi:signal transduction histidine kinase